MKELISKRLKEIESITEEIFKNLTIDCKKGCSYCCYGVPLIVPVIETYQIVEFLNNLPVKIRKEIAKNLKEYKETFIKEAKSLNINLEEVFTEEEIALYRLEIITGLKLKDLPCPFLNDLQECLIYSVRPLMCRLTVFKDKKICEKDFNEPLLFLWKNEIEPFIEKVKKEFFKRWLFRIRNIYPSEDIFISLERYYVFLPLTVKFDITNKKFKVILK